MFADQNLNKIRENIIGNYFFHFFILKYIGFSTVLKTNFGEKLSLYADNSATGKPYK